jgi:hypothetical protein
MSISAASDATGAATAKAENAVETSSLVFKAKPLRSKAARTQAGRDAPIPAHARPDKTSPNRGVLPFSEAIPDLVE